MRDAQFALLLDQHLVKREPRGVYFSGLGRGENRAAGLVDVTAIAEFAGANIRAEIGHAVGDIVIR